MKLVKAWTLTTQVCTIGKHVNGPSSTQLRHQECKPKVVHQQEDQQQKWTQKRFTLELEWGTVASPLLKPLWVHPALCMAWYCVCTWIIQCRQQEGFQTHVQVGSREIGPLQIGTAQVGVSQIAAAQIGHFKIDVAQIKSGQIGTTEIKSLKTLRGIELNINKIWENGLVNENT